MALIRKTQAGSDSFGHVWPEDGAVVEIDDAEQIACLMAIPDAGFTEVTPASGGDAPQQDPDGDSNTGPDAKKEVSEIDPNAPAAEPEAKPAAKKTAARKTATGSQSVEE